jgi:hypothetical protein
LKTYREAVPTLKALGLEEGLRMCPTLERHGSEMRYKEEET